MIKIYQNKSKCQSEIFFSLENAKELEVLDSECLNKIFGGDPGGDDEEDEYPNGRG